MAYEQKDNAGSLFKNDDRTESNNQPNARGKCRISGVEYRVSAWTRTSASGTKYQALAFEPAQKPDPVGPVNAKEVVDDEIPF
jgi:hypothetical protein